jgi:hypothetical protein
MIRPATSLVAFLVTGALAACATTVPKADFVAKPLAAPIEVWFWLNPDASASSDPRIVWTDEHPCGAAAGMRVTSIPDDTQLIQADVVSEFNDRGDETGTWRVPIDFEVEEVRGNLIGISNNAGLNLWIDRSGRIFRRVPSASPQDSVACPVLERYRGSGYLQCFSTPDAGSGHKRLIAWQGICT